MFRHIAIGLVICCLSSFASAHPGGVDKDGCHKDSRTGERHCHSERAKHAKKEPHYDSEHPPRAGDEGVFYGPFVAMVDGDTFKAKVQGVVMDFRLQGIDAPEHDQPYGSISTNMLREIIGGRDLVLVFDDVDRYGRIVVQAWVANLDVNAEMVRRGAAWFESEYAYNDEIYWIEQQARDRKAGLWALPLADRIPPWDWRDKKR